VLKSTKKKGWGRKRLSEDVEFIGLKVAAFEKQAFCEMCKNKSMPVSERIQLLIARDLHHEKAGENQQKP